MDNEKSYLAINGEATLFTTFNDLDECLQMRAVYVCNHLTILHKGGSGKDCLFDLHNNQFSSADKTCNYRVRPSSDIAVRLSDTEIYVYSPNATTLTSNYPGLGKKKLNNKRSGILSAKVGPCFT